jgi:L-ascorbate metabolism protein UlaG (beta-lactamase superfamily)
MDIQFYGANCISLSYKTTRIVIDDNLKLLGKKSIIKTSDVVLFTSENQNKEDIEAKIIIDCPGEYEVADISIVGIPARAHIDDPTKHLNTMYKIATNDINLLVTGHIFPKLSDEQLELIGMNDVLIIPVGGHGYTLDPQGALKIIKEVEPKLVIPTHYALPGLNYEIPQTSLEDALKEMSMEPKERVTKLKLRFSDLSDVTQLVVLEV